VNTQTPKNPIYVNEPFVCKYCKEANPKAEIGCRNHCRNCLYSMHVDDQVPGDRSSKCLGLMQPIDIEISQKKGFKILHRCKLCGKMMYNKMADDDDLYLITQLIKTHNERTQKMERKNKEKEQDKLYGKKPTNYNRKRPQKKHKK